MSEVKLRLNNREYRGWTSVKYSKSIDAIASKVEIGLVDRFNDSKIFVLSDDSIGSDTGNQFPIFPGVHFDLLIDDTELIRSGHINTINSRLDSNSSNIIITGKDQTGDLVISSAIIKSGELLDVKLEKIVSELAAPFGIRVSSNVDTGERFLKFNIEQGETVFEAINRACALRGVLPISDGTGGILIDSSSQDIGAALEEGKNIKSVSINSSENNRFSKYIVLGQQSGSDDFDGIASSQVKGEAKDAFIKRYKPLTIIADSSVSTDSAIKMAGWEASVRAARSQSLNVTVQGWYAPNNILWDVNKLVKCVIPSFGINQTLLIQSIVMSQREAGTETTMTLVRKDAFIAKPNISESDDIFSGILIKQGDTGGHA